MQSLAPSERRSDSDAALEENWVSLLVEVRYLQQARSVTTTNCSRSKRSLEAAAAAAAAAGRRPRSSRHLRRRHLMVLLLPRSPRFAGGRWGTSCMRWTVAICGVKLPSSLSAAKQPSSSSRYTTGGWKKKWDEWLPASCPRVRPLPADYHMKRGRTLELLQVPSAAEQREFAVASSAAAAGFRTAAHVTCAANEAAEAAKNAAAKNAELKAALARAADGDTRSLAAAAEAAEAAAAEAAAASQRAKVAQAEAAKLRIAADDNREGADDNVGGSSRCESAGYDEDEDDESGPLPSVARTFSSSTMLPSSSSAARQGRGRGAAGAAAAPAVVAEADAAVGSGRGALPALRMP